MWRFKKEEANEKVRKAQAKADIMESLSRTLQTERNELKETLKKYEPVAVAAPVPEPQAESQPAEAQQPETVQVDTQASNTQSEVAPETQNVSQEASNTATVE